MNVSIVKINKKKIFFLVQEIEPKMIGHLKCLIEKNLKTLFLKNNMEFLLLDFFKTDDDKNISIKITHINEIFPLTRKYIRFFNKETYLIKKIKNIIYLAEDKAKEYYEMSNKPQNDVSKILIHSNFQNQN